MENMRRASSVADTHHQPVSRFDRLFSYWILAWFVVYIVGRVMLVTCAHQYSNTVSTYLINPLWPLVSVAFVNVLYLLYTLYLVVFDNLVQRFPCVLQKIGLFLIANISIKVIPVLILRYGDNILFPLPTVREGLASLGVTVLLCGGWLLWRQVTGGIWYTRGKESWKGLVSNGVATANGPLMNIFHKAFFRII